MVNRVRLRRFSILVVYVVCVRVRSATRSRRLSSGRPIKLGHRWLGCCNAVKATAPASIGSDLPCGRPATGAGELGEFGVALAADRHIFANANTTVPATRPANPAV